MSTYRLGLWFREVKGQVPGPPICHVFVKMPLSYDYSDAEGVVFLTPREYGPEIIGNQIDALITELQEIKTEARRRYDEYARNLKVQESN
jgi:hypothetical protein